MKQLINISIILMLGFVFTTLSGCSVQEKFVSNRESLSEPISEKPEEGSDVEKDKKLDDKWKITDDASLPRVLILGDSISIGYTLQVRELLKGKANIHRALNEQGIKENCAGTTHGLKRIDFWLGEKKWDLIHFNWGLHDLKYVNEKGQKVDPSKGRQQAVPDQYRKNLEVLVERLKKTGAKLVFATTIPYVEGCAGRKVGDELVYNKIAKEIMKKHKVTINDTWAVINPKLKEYAKERNVHLKKEGTTALSKHIAKVIEKELGSKDIPYWLSEYEDAYKKNPRNAARKWFSETKFGMFVHLALASLCENGKADYVLWEEGLADDRLLKFVGVSRNEYESAENKDQLLFERYLLPEFDAEKICQLAVKAQMKYVNFTTLHLGRCFNFDTKVSSFNSVNAPCNRDLVAEMAAACQKYGLALFLYLSPEYAQDNPDTRQRNLNVIRELLTNYGPIAGIWFDGIGYFYSNPGNYTKLKDTFDYIRSIQPHCLVSFKEGAICAEDFISPEHFMLPFGYDWDTTGRGQQWQMRKDRWDIQNAERWKTCNQYKLREVNTVMQECFNRDAVHVKSGWINDESARHLSADEVYYWLTYARFTGSNLLMNIGPRADGSIHPDDVEALEEVGRIILKKGWPKLHNNVKISN
ncbi:MAG: alpha-L-fucosidase [Planctomycetes bacterium]|nr:alpha-L-fucosidase [Planctomycetota bacterium]